jgi:hypothetical protein
MTKDSATLNVGVQVRMAVGDYIASIEKAKKRGSGFKNISNGILGSLCCPYMSRGEGHESGTSYRVPEITAFQRGSAKACIPNLLVAAMSIYPHAVASKGCLLAGLNRARCWDSCLESDDKAYALAAAICYFSETFDDQDAFDLKTAPDVLSVLNQWLAPPTPWTNLPSALEIARSFFGAGWCDLVASGWYEGIGKSAASNKLITSAILRDRPQFLPGRYTKQDGIGQEDLPRLETAY